jgi:uncharacterized membrane protein YoaK (UPF0700 family)
MQSSMQHAASAASDRIRAGLRSEESLRVAILPSIDRGRYWLAMITLMIEITVLFVVMALHVRLPDVASTVDISFAAAMQTASFARVEGRPYSPVMVTGNLRNSVETFFTGRLGKRNPVVIICTTFALAAAIGALLTKLMESRALLVPIVLLLTALFLCRRLQDR